MAGFVMDCEDFFSVDVSNDNLADNDLELKGAI